MGGKFKDRSVLRGDSIGPFVEAIRSESTRVVYEDLARLLNTDKGIAGEHIRRAEAYLRKSPWIGDWYVG